MGPHSTPLTRSAHSTTLTSLTPSVQGLAHSLCSLRCGKVEVYEYLFTLLTLLMPISGKIVFGKTPIVKGGRWEIFEAGLLLLTSHDQHSTDKASIYFGALDICLNCQIFLYNRNSCHFKPINVMLVKCAL